MVRTLAERLRAHEQQKARLAEAEARLRVDERRQRNRRLSDAGALIDKAGLLDLESDALYGALLSLRDGADDAQQVAQWAVAGARTLAQESDARDEGKEPVLLTFTTALAKDATMALRRAGFRYSRVMQHWEGLARYADAVALAKPNGGTVVRVGTAAVAAAESDTAASVA